MSERRIVRGANWPDALGRLVVAAGVVSLSISGVAAQSITISGDLPDGGDCPSVGTWDSTFNVCEVHGLVLESGTQLTIENARLRACDLANRKAEIDNSGTLEITGRFVNTGTIMNRPGASFWIDDYSAPNWSCAAGPKDNLGTIDNAGDLFFFAPTDNAPGGLIHGSGIALISLGPLRNSGTVSIDGTWTIDDTFQNSAEGTVIVNGAGFIWADSLSELVNHGRWDNHGSMSGSFWSLNNHGTFNNHNLLTTCHDLGSYGAVHNYASLNNFGNMGLCSNTLENFGTINNSGLIRDGATFQDPVGTVENSGAIVNCGSLTAPVVGDPETAAVDDDGDDYCNQLDCAPVDATTWSTPSEARLLRLSHGIATPGVTDLEWALPQYPGASTVLYDVVSSADPADFLFEPPATCVETADGSDLVAADAINPGPGEFASYLVRASDSCGKGSAGSASDGELRLVRDCP